MSFAREGYPFAVAGLLLAGLCWAGVWVRVADPASWPGRALLVSAWACSALAVFVLWFFRDPPPVLAADAAAVVAPGQGKIILVEDVDHVDVVDGPATKISIFLSVFDVHVQRAPVSGEVVHKEYRPGKYLAAWNDKASEDNEQGALGIRTEEGTVLVKQIAGLVARRIITDPDVGDDLERGERFGLIRFGSRVDLFLPAHWEVTGAVGDRVIVGSTAIARRVPVPAAAAQDQSQEGHAPADGSKTDSETADMAAGMEESR
ncbi:MAG: phosphatidylserine decarboxylase [Gemmatimonadetes bacterium]|nr:phosphatidylserine decarboxylase [Gemmatimonadota bacterium]NNF14323.1 phosphatidylserine decarboxylase [Gemmatimonadota bacterium]NNL30147.1 phosphatidylserine decarboxylase [Gemmatimonadota bacterium]